jgi:hypothetical protein
VDDLPHAKTCDANAFVKNGYLSATFEDPDESGAAEFWLNSQNTGRRDPLSDVQLSPGFRMRLLSASMVGKLIQTGGIWTLDEATLGGFTTPDLVLSSFAELGFCEQSCRNVHSVTQGVLVREMLTSGRASTESCNAISIGWEFKARQTGIGKEDTTPPDPVRRVPLFASECDPVGDATLCFK